MSSVALVAAVLVVGLLLYVVVFLWVCSLLEAAGKRYPTPEELDVVDLELERRRRRDLTAAGLPPGSGSPSPRTGSGASI